METKHVQIAKLVSSSLLDHTGQANGPIQLSLKTGQRFHVHDRARVCDTITQIY